MTPERLTEELQPACGQALISVMLYGSAVAGDHVRGQSDYNVLVVLKQLEAAELSHLSPIARRWSARGNPSPLLLTPETFRRSATLFPLEIADMKESHRVLYGQDLLSQLTADPLRLRDQLDQELHGKLLQLRGQYLLAAGRPTALERLLVQSLSTFLVLFRGALRLYQEHIPHAKMAALEQLAQHVPVPLVVFRQVASLRSRHWPKGSGELERLFADYLSAVTAIVGAVEERLHTGQGGP